MDVLLLAVNSVLGLSDVFLFFFQSSLRSFFNLKDVGFVQVKILRAEGLMAADVTGKITCHFLYSFVPSGTMTKIPAWSIRLFPKHFS